MEEKQWETLTKVAFEETLADSQRESSKQSVLSANRAVKFLSSQSQVADQYTAVLVGVSEETIIN